MNSITFSDAFEALTGHRPFPWQEKMYNEHLVKGNPPPCCNLPTGLGKTAIMPIWLIALATMGNNKTVAGERLPRRLVYVVNRRTVVDQATREAENLRKKLEKPESPVLQELARRLRQLAGSVDGNGEALPLAISTLRGEFADNGEWSADPSRPAIIVGTVDMIGSRLLFSGYGCRIQEGPCTPASLGRTFSWSTTRPTLSRPSRNCWSRSRMNNRRSENARRRGTGRSSA